MTLRAGPVVVKPSRNGFAKADPKTVSLTLVEAREVDPPANQTPLLWRLLTTVAVNDADGACEIVRLYRLRWRIEEVFRALKSEGMRLEAAQMHAAGRLFKLAAIGFFDFFDPAIDGSAASLARSNSRLPPGASTFASTPSTSPRKRVSS